MTDEPVQTVIRFGIFEVDLRSAELRKGGLRVQLQSQPFRVLALLLRSPGGIVTREEIVQELWGDDTFVDFDQSVGAVIRKLRRALGDSATSPRYIETLRQKGYRFLVPVQASVSNTAALSSGRAEVFQRGYYRAMYGVVALALAAIVILVLAAFKNRVQPSSRGGPVNMDAYIAYQKGRFLWNARTPESLHSSIGYLERAVELDPKSAQAHAGLANSYAILDFYTGRPGALSLERAHSESRHALSLDDSMHEARTTEAYIKLHRDWDWHGAESAFRDAIALNPNYATAHQWYAEYLMYTGRFQEAQREIHRAHQLEPQSVIISLQLASPHFFSRQFEKALTGVREALTLDPTFPLGIYMLGTCHEQLGDFDGAIREYRKIGDTNLGLMALGYACGRAGRTNEAREILHTLLREANGRTVSPYHVARVYAGIGDTAEAFAWLRKALEGRDQRMVMLKVDPKLETLRSEKSFTELVRRVGLS